MKNSTIKTSKKDPGTKDTQESITSPDEKKVEEIGGFKGPEPTRYGDWEKNGRCFDF